MLMMHHVFYHLGIAMMTTTLAHIITIKGFGALPHIDMIEPIGKHVTVC